MTAGTLALTGAIVPLAQARGSDTMRVGVIGCGGRGSGAARDCVKSSRGVEIVALADVFEDRLRSLKTEFKVPNDRCFVGLDAYNKLLALDDINLVILGTPPGFRPKQFAEAIRRGKNVFMEKPVATCPTGIKMVIETSEKASQKGLAVVAGTQTYGKGSVNILRPLKDGAGLYITTARWFTPNGRLIEGKGLSPDHELELTGDDAILWAIDYLEKNK